MIQVVECHFEVIFCILLRPNSCLVRSSKHCFKWSPGIENTFSSSWPGQNANCFKWWKRCFKGSHVNLTHFPHLDHPNLRLGWGKESNVSSVRMSLSTYLRPQDQPEMLLGWRQKIDFFSGYKALRTYFLPLDQTKMRFGWIRKSDDSSCRMSLWGHSLLFVQPKMRLFF